MLNENDVKYMTQVFTFWDKLSDNQKATILDTTVPVQYKKGTTIHAGDSDCVGVLIIKKGELRVYMLSEEGKDITLYRLREGDICTLSASCILKSITFEVNIDAETNCDVLQLDAMFYNQLCNQNIYAENFSQKVVIERFSDVMWTIEQILFMSFDKRLAIFLSDEMNRKQQDIIELTHEQIAKYVGSAREVVSRMLKYFASEGIVELSRGGVKIIDKKKLKKLI